MTVRAPWRQIMSAIIGILILAFSGCREDGPTSIGSPEPGGALSASPYAGYQERSIRALSEEQVADLLAGRGAGYALAAELNHYPGPLHTLELGDDLELTADQRKELEVIRMEMQSKARDLGQEVVDLERQLDQAFRDGGISATDVERLTNEIALVEGRLRATHLVAHLQTTDIMSDEQIARYDMLRGYTGNGDPEHDPEHQHGTHP